MIFFNLKFLQNHPPKRHIKYKVIDFDPSTKSIMANKIPSTKLERFLRRINLSKCKMAIFKHI